MTDFLTRMARRTWGVAPTLKPLTLPRFAPEPIAPPYADGVSEPSGDAQITANGPPAHSVDSSVNEEEKITFQQEITPRPDVTERHPPEYRSELKNDTERRIKTTVEVEKPPHASHIHKESVPVDSQSPRSDMVPIAVAGPSPLRTKLEPTRLPEELERNPKGDEPLVAPVPSMPVPPPSTINGSVAPPDDPFGHGVDPAMDAMDAFDPAIEMKGDRLPEPTVNVTIGRIEVRAVHNDPPQPVKPPKPAYRPTLSLNDYLHQRQQGKR